MKLGRLALHHPRTTWGSGQGVGAVSRWVHSFGAVPRWVHPFGCGVRKLGKLGRWGKIGLLGLAGIVFLGMGVVLLRDGDGSGGLVWPVAIESQKLSPEPEQARFRARVKSQKLEIVRELREKVAQVKTTDSYPPSRWFPSDWQPKYGELTVDEVSSTPGRVRSTPDMPGVSARAYLVYDKTRGQILYAKNHIQELPIASLVKIMTAAVVLERIENGALEFDTRLIVPEEAAEVGEAFMGLKKNESIRVEDLLYGLMLNSGNDAAETLAYGIGGRADNRERFVVAMNKKAAELGMRDTWFANPTGLDEETVEESSFSSALDLLALTNYALKNETFREIVAAKHWNVPYVENKHKAFYLTNKLDLGKAHPAIKGVKPGTTEFAGNTLVSYGELDGQEYIIIMLNSPHIRDETVQIYKLLYGK